MTINPDVAEPTAVDATRLLREDAKQALTPGQLVWRRFRKHRMALIGAIGIAAVVLFVLVGSILIPEKAANRGDLTVRLKTPMAGHIFGTDSTGRDVFNRVIYGGQISLLIGVL